MTLSWLLAALHLMALGIGLGAVFARGQALRSVPGDGALQRAFVADNFWALAGLLWISTGLVRAFGGFEKGTAYYLDSTVFWVKMALLLVIIVLEVTVGLTLMRWRLARRRSTPVDTSAAPRLAFISYVQTSVILLMLLLATAMARGLDF